MIWLLDKIPEGLVPSALALLLLSGMLAGLGGCATIDYDPAEACEELAGRLVCP